MTHQRSKIQNPQDADETLAAGSSIERHLIETEGMAADKPIEAEHKHLLTEMQQLATIVENHPDFISICTLSGQVLYINPAGLKMMGLPSGYDVKMMGVVDFYPAAEGEILINEGIPVALKEGSWSTGANLLKADGATVPVEQTISTNYDVDGNSISFSITMRDITERRQAEEALRLSEARHRALLNAIPDLIIRLNRDGTYLDVKLAKDFPALAPPDEMLGKNMFDLLPPKLAKQRMYYMEQALQTGEVQIYEHKLMRDNKERHEEIRVVPSGENEILMMIRDITERRTTETERERLLSELQTALAEAKIFRQLVESSGQGVGFASLDGQLVYMNPTFARILDEENHKLALGKSIIDYYPEALQKKVLDEIFPAVMQRGSWQGETTLISTKGKQTEVIDNYLLLRDENGQPLYIADVVTDITERKQAEAERERLLAEVEAAYRQYVRQEWEQFLGERYQQAWKIEYQHTTGEDDLSSEIIARIKADVAHEGQTKIISGAANHGMQVQAAIITPVSLRGQVIGTLGLEDFDPNRHWTDEEKALVEAVSEQLALTIENLRLFDETQKRASRERLTRQITDKMRAAPDVDTIIQTGLKELSRVLGISRSYVRLITDFDQSASAVMPDEEARRQSKRGDAEPIALTPLIHHEETESHSPWEEN